MTCKQVYILDGDTSPILVTLERDGTPLAISLAATVTAKLRRAAWGTAGGEIEFTGGTVTCASTSPADWPNGVVAIAWDASVTPGVWDLCVTVTQSGTSESYVLDSAIRVLAAT